MNFLHQYRIYFQFSFGWMLHILYKIIRKCLTLWNSMANSLLFSSLRHCTASRTARWESAPPPGQSATHSPLHTPDSSQSADFKLLPCSRVNVHLVMYKNTQQDEEWTLFLFFYFLQLLVSHPHHVSSMYGHSTTSSTPCTFSWRVIGLWLIIIVFKKNHRMTVGLWSRGRMKPDPLIWQRKHEQKQKGRGVFNIITGCFANVHAQHTHAHTHKLCRCINTHFYLQTPLSHVKASKIVNASCDRGKVCTHIIIR